MKSWKTFAAVATLAIASVHSAYAARTDLVLGMPLEPPHLDPTAGAAAAIDEVLYANVFEGLTRIGASGEVLPALAESWTVSDDQLTWTFKLRKTNWSDGTPLTAKDFEYSLRRLEDPTTLGAVYASVQYPIKHA